MIPRVWRLSENSDDENLGLACAEHGLVLGRTPLIERRNGRFVVRECNEIECLLSLAYGRDFAADRLMPGLATVAAALNANDQGLARIAAVHLQIPDLPDQAARDAMEAADVLIKYSRDEGGGASNWNPALHPRAGTPPNPGWFSPTDGADNESSPIRTAENENPKQSSDASPGQGDEWVRLQPAKRIDELGDFAEWLANATPEDEKAIRAEIKRYFADVGWEDAAHDLNRKLSIVLRPDVTREIRQSVLNHVDLYTRADPAEYAGTRDFLDAIVLAGAGLLATPGGPSPVWKLGWAERGRRINKQFGDSTFPDNYPTIDKIPDGAASSVKSMDLNAATYQKEGSLTYRLESYVAKVREFEGAEWGGTDISGTDIDGRAVHLIVPKGSMTEEQRIIIESVRARAMRDRKKPVDIIITEF
jgi:hypothetical protein